MPASLTFRGFLFGLAVLALQQQPADAQVAQTWDNTLGAQLKDIYNNLEWLYQGSTTPGAVRTVNNILDDGFGTSTLDNLVVPGVITGPTIANLTSAVITVGNGVQVNGAAITALQQRATTDETAFSALQTQLTADESLITNNAAAIATNTQNIASNAAGIATVTGVATANGAAITALQTRATTDESAIASNAANIGSLNATVLSQGGSIAALQGAVTVIQATPNNPLALNVTAGKDFAISNPANSAVELRVSADGSVHTLFNTVDDGTSGQATFVGITTDTIQSLNAQQDSLTLNAKKVQFSGDISVNGNLILNGVKQTLSTATVSVENGVIELGTNNTISDTLNLGFTSNYFRAGAPQYGGLVRPPSSANDINAGEWVLYETTQDPGALYTAGNPWTYNYASLVGANVHTTQGVSTDGVMHANGTLSGRFNVLDDAITGSATIQGLLTANGGASVAGQLSSNSINTGAVGATTGAFTGGVTADSLSNTGGSGSISNSGVVTATSVNAGTGAIAGGAITAAGALSGQTLSVSGALFTVDNTGAATAASITTGSGSISGGSISGSSVSASGDLSGNTLRVGIRGLNGFDALGSLTAKDATITGTTNTQALLVNAAFGIDGNGAATVSSLDAGAGDINTIGDVNADSVSATGSVTALSVSASGPMTANNITLAGMAQAQSFISTSDMRLKSNIQTLDHMTNHILRIKPVKYHFTSDKSKKVQHGVLAQQVRDVFPDAVHVSDNGFLAVSYQDLISPMIKTIHELNARIELLEQHKKA